LSGCSACGCFDLVRLLLGSSGAILEREEVGVEDFSVNQLHQVDVGESGEDRLPARGAEYQREHG
jgi:hypothetical protein